ncbi:hypothetical protein ABN303_09250 [Providencia rettgeri]
MHNFAELPKEDKDKVNVDLVTYSEILSKLVIDFEDEEGKDRLVVNDAKFIINHLYYRYNWN